MSDSLKLGFYKVRQEAFIPEFATEGAACFDFKASVLSGEKVKYYSSDNSVHTHTIEDSNSLTLLPKCRYLVPTNLILDIPEGYSVRIHPRSGLALKQAITLLNCEGVIDSDYIDPTYVTLFNNSDVEFVISNGDRIAQGELVRSEQYSTEEIISQPTKKSSRTGGFGSTGVH